MTGRGRWARWVTAALLTAGTVVAFVSQFAPVLIISGQWAGNHAVAAGGCGWDGTCSDAGIDATMGPAVALLLGELVIAALLERPRRIAVMVMAACLVSWAVMLQDALVVSLTAGHALDDQGRAQLFLTWFTRALMADGAIALVCGLAWFLATRRRRPRTPPSPLANNAGT